MRALAALVCGALLLCACGEGTSPATVASFPTASAPATSPGADGPSFSGTYAVQATNTGDEGEGAWSATWRAEPVCAAGACDATLTISRPGFDPYQVTAQHAGGRWTWKPATTLLCPESGSPFTVAGQGFRMRPTDVRRIDGGETVTRLEGEVVAILRASGCATQHLRYAVAAERIG